MAVDIFDAENRKPVDIFEAEGGASPKRQVGAGEAFATDLGGGFAGQANVLGLAGATPFMAADAVRNLFRKTPTTAAQDWYFGEAYEPVVKNAVDYYAPKPGEERGVGAQVAGAAGSVASAVPAMLASGGANSTVMLPRIAEMLFRGAVTAQPSFAVPQTVNRAQQLLEADVDRPTVAKASASNLAFNTALGAAPVSVPGRLLTRVPTGAGINVAGGAASRGTEGVILGPENARVAQAPFGIAENSTDAILGAVMAGLFGRRGNVQPRAAPRPELRLEPTLGDRVPYDPAPIYDPQAAVREVGDALFRTDSGAPQPPDGMQLLPKGFDAPAGVRPVPDVSEVPVRVAPEWLTEWRAQQPRRELGELPAADELSHLTLAPKGEALPPPIRPDVSEVPAPVAPDFELVGAPRGVKRGFDEPPIDTSAAPPVRLADAVARATSGMKANVPMSLLHTIAGAARDSGLESQIRPRIVALDQEQPPATRPSAAPQAALPQIAQLPQAKPPEPPAPPPGKPVREVRKGSSFLQAIKKAGGIDPSFAADIGGDTAMVLNRRMPGLIRKGGLTADGLREWAEDNGYILKVDAERADREGIGGAQELARDLVRRAMGDEDVLPVRDQEDAWAQREAEKARAQDAEHKWRMENDPEYRAEQESEGNARAARVAAEEAARQAEEAAQWAAEEAAAVGLKPADAADLDAVARAAKIDENAVESLAMQYPDGGPEFMEGIRRITNGERPGDQASTRGEAAEPPTGGTEAATGGNTRPELSLEQPTEAGLRAQAEAERRAGEQRRRVEEAPPPSEFTLTGSDRPADEAAARGQESLFDTPREAKREPWEKSFEEWARDHLAHYRRTFNVPESALKVDDELFRQHLDHIESALEAGKRVPDSAFGGHTAVDPKEYPLSAKRWAERGDNGNGPKEDRPGGTTLYGGIPLNKVADALKWAFGDVKAWSDSIGRFAQDIRNAIDRVPHPEGNPVGRFLRAIFDSASGDMRSVLKKNHSPTAQHIVDQFHTEAGSSRVTGEIYSSAVNGWTNKQLSALDAVLKQFEGNTPALEQIAALVRNPRNIKPGTKIHEAAHTIRQLLDGALKYMREAGVNIGEVRDGYYPREFDMRSVMRDTNGFIEAAAQAYRETGFSAQDATAAAKQLHDTLVFGETGSVFVTDRGSPQAPFLKGRVFGKQVDSSSHPLHQFMLHDPSLAIPIYLERAAKRAEIARRFGDNFEKWGALEKKIVAEGGGAILEKLRDYVTLAARLKAPGVSNWSLRASSWARTWGALMFLEKATLSSLTEFIVPAMRAGNPLDIARSLRNTLSDLFTKTESAAERRAFAEDLGIIASKLSDQVSAARFSGGEPVSMLESKILAKYFRRTGMTQWTDATFVSAADLGRVFIRRLAKDMDGDGGKLTRRHLAELGVPEAQAAAFAKYALSKNDGLPGAGDLDGAMGDLYRNAIRRFAQQSIMRPDATLRPGWMAHPIGSIVGQLQSFNYAFFENVLKRNARLAKEALTEADYTMLERAKLLTPALMLPMLVAAAYAIGEARDAAFGDPERRKEETKGQKLLKAVSRGMPIAPIDPILNYATSARYQRGSADVFAGPVLGTSGRGLDAARNVLLNNNPKTNTSERQAAKAVYDLFIEPTVNLMLTGSPVTIAAAATTQTIGSGRIREKFVSAVAGPAKPKKSPASAQ